MPHLNQVPRLILNQDHVLISWEIEQQAGDFAKKQSQSGSVVLRFMIIGNSLVIEGNEQKKLVELRLELL